MIEALAALWNQTWIDVTNTERGCLRDPADGALALCGRPCPTECAEDYRECPDYDPPKTYCGKCVRTYMLHAGPEKKSPALTRWQQIAIDAQRELNPAIEAREQARAEVRRLEATILARDREIKILRAAWTCSRERARTLAKRILGYGASSDRVIREAINTPTTHDTPRNGA
jgi:hypothetical protein